MILTVTLNPAVDRTVVLPELRVGEVNRIREGRTDPGGKGINVSRVLRELGCGSLAMGFVAGSLGRYIEASLNEVGIRDDFIHTPGQTRTNVSVVESHTHRQTSLNEPGPETDAHYLKELQKRLAAHLANGDWLVLAGSVPPGVAADAYGELVALASGNGAFAALDADGDLLRKGVLAKPCLVKPNKAELERLVGRALPDDQAVAAAAMELHKSGISYVVVSMAAEGAIAIGPGASGKGSVEVLRGFAPKVTVKSGVGAGDSLVAGLVLGLSEGKGLLEGLRLGMAAGAATASAPGTMLGRRADIERLIPEVRIEDFGANLVAR